MKLLLGIRIAFKILGNLILTHCSSVISFSLTSCGEHHYFRIYRQICNCIDLINGQDEQDTSGLLRKRSKERNACVRMDMWYSIWMICKCLLRNQLVSMRTIMF